MDEASVGRRLYDENGWYQGCLFRPPTGATYTTNVFDADTSSIREERSQFSGDEFLILITQDCDLVANDEDEPYVEGLLCNEVPADRYPHIGNSYRAFPLDSQKKLVVLAAPRVFFDKRILLSLSPQPWAQDEERRQAFIRWLAGRYARPALHDQLVQAFQKPLIDSLRRTKTDGWEALNGILSEVRISNPVSDQPPWSVDVLFMVESEALTEEQLGALEALWTRMLEVANGEANRGTGEQPVIELAEYLVHTPGTVYLGEYRATVPLALSEFSFKGHNVAQPPSPS